MVPPLAIAKKEFNTEFVSVEGMVRRASLGGVAAAARTEVCAPEHAARNRWKCGTLGNEKG